MSLGLALATTSKVLQWLLVVMGVLSSIFVYSLDNTIVADITPVRVENPYKYICTVGVGLTARRRQSIDLGMLLSYPGYLLGR